MLIPASRQLPAAARKLTARDVAVHAGVSVGTVSRVVNGISSVRQDVRERVQQSITALGWTPNIVAQNMRGRATRMIGFIFSDIRNPLYASMIKGAEDVLTRHGYMLLIASSDGLPEREIAFIELFRQRQAEGLVFSVSQEDHPGVLGALSGAGYPFVMLEREVALPAATVGADHLSGTRNATRYLLGLGHRRIAMVSGGRDNRVGRDRLKGFLDAHHEAGVQADPDLIRHDSFSEEYGFSQAQLLLELPDPPTAIVVLGQHLLRGVLTAARRQGVAVPQQLSLLVSNDSELAQLATPSISVIRYDSYALGREAALLLLRRLREGAPAASTAPAHVLVPTELVLRDSCAPPPRVRPATRDSTALPLMELP